MREIEVKFKIKNLDDIQKKLKEKGCSLSDPIS